MAPSPWALIRNAEQPLETQTATPWASIPEDPMQQSDTRIRPVVSHLGGEGPGSAITPTIAAHLGTNPRNDEIANTQDQLAKIRWNRENPWGTAENHPGKLGKVAHVFSEIGNIAGNVVAPNVMANIEGTQLGNRVKENQLTGRLNTELEQKGLEDQQAATTGHLNAQTQEEAPNAAATRTLQGQTGHHLDVESNLAEHPLPSYTPLGYLTPEGQATEMETHTGAVTGAGPEGLHYGRAIDKFQHVDGTVNGVPVKAFADPINHTYVDQQGNEIPKFRPMPQVGMQGPIVVSGEGKVSRATPGTTLPSDFRTVSQGGALNVPTSQMRNMGEMAATVLPMAENVKSEVQQLASSIGPAAGRWNDLMVNKGGADFPEFAGLDQDLDLLSSAIVRTHFGARGGQQYREELRKMLGAAQSPEDLISRIDHADSWLRGYAQAGGAKVPTFTPNAPGQPPPGSNIIKFADVK